MSRLPLIVVLLALVGPMPRAVAMHDPDITNAEFKCQLATGKLGPKYMRTVLKCATKCDQGFFKGLNPALDCYPPFGGVTAACVGNAPGQSGGKLRTAIAKACDPGVTSSADCPECYDAAVGNAGCGEAGFANDEQQLLYDHVSTYVPSLLCKTTGASKAEQRCQQNATKAVSKHLGKIYKCFGKCFEAAHAGDGTAADCMPNPVLPNDVGTQNCLGLSEIKTAASIDKACTSIGVDVQCPLLCQTNAGCDSAPAAGDGVCTNGNCSAGNTSTSAYPTGSQFALLVTVASAGNIVDGGLGPDTGIYCGE